MAKQAYVVVISRFGNPSYVPVETDSRGDIYGDGPPEGKQIGSPGMIYVDVQPPEKKYRKATGENTTTGWVEL